MENESKWEEVKRYFSWWPLFGWKWRFRNFINIIDDPVDEIKHSINGIRIFGWEIHLPKWLMKGSGDKSK